MSKYKSEDILDSQSILSTSTSINEDGRFQLDVRKRSHRFTNFFSSSRQDIRVDDALNYIPLLDETESTTSSPEETFGPPPPPLNIVIQIVGSRGDVQPFVALGCTLKEFGHRVRIATHAVFKSFVEEYGLEFFNIGGNPEELMAFMVRNPGLFPNYDAVRNGDVKIQRQNMTDILNGCWKSCVEIGDGIAPHDGGNNTNFGPGNSKPKPFVADAIIANPPSFAHIHCAEKLGIPLHLMFTRMPYSPTEAFPHPLVSIRMSELGSNITNRLSYALIERLTWHGLGDIINKFRESTLGLEPLNIMMAAGLLTRLKIPYTYCWSPYLLPKPRDWGAHISISGFYFLQSSSEFKPTPDLVKFIEDGDPPIYVGFGSIVVDNPEAMTSMVLEAIRLAGVRALLSKGWSDLGEGDIELPETVRLLDNVPHSWLFQHVSAVVHHGGAGTTAAGLYAGKPTVIVPFFGDQSFWGEMVANAGAGPQPIPYANQTAQTLAQQIIDALHPELKIRARHLGLKLQDEQGCENGMNSFHRSLRYDNSRCSILHDKLAVWQTRGTLTRLSAVAAATLLEHGLLRLQDLEPVRHRVYHIEDRPIDPISGGASAFLSSFGDILYQTYDLPRQITKAATKPSTWNNGSSSNLSLHTVSEIGSEGRASMNTLRETSKTSLGAAEASSNSLDPSLEKAQDVALATVKGIGKLSKAVLTTPLYFTMGIARGFQNIPIAYNDTTVRRPEKVDGIQTGFEVAVSQFAYGFYDGISGVVTQPFEGAKENGALGFITGIGKGIGGLVLKPGAGLFALPAYTLQGISQEVRRVFGTNYERQIAYSRLAQGRDEMELYSNEELQSIVLNWTQLQQEKIGEET